MLAGLLLKFSKVYTISSFGACLDFKNINVDTPAKCCFSGGYQIVAAKPISAAAAAAAAGQRLGRRMSAIQALSP
jgi:hypothetical protein